jgi:hypothetical protein
VVEILVNGAQMKSGAHGEGTRDEKMLANVGGHGCGGRDAGVRVDAVRCAAS